MAIVCFDIISQLPPAICHLGGVVVGSPEAMWSDSENMINLGDLGETIGRRWGNSIFPFCGP